MCNHRRTGRDRARKAPNNPKDEKGVENKNNTRQSGIQGDGEDNREHDSSLVPIFYAARSLTSAEVADRAQCAQQKKRPLTSTPWPITRHLHCSQMGAMAWIAHST